MIFVSPARTGNLLRNSAIACLLTGRYPFSARIFCAGYVLRYREKAFHSALFSLFSSAAM